MLEDKDFFNTEVTPSVTKLIDEVKLMMEKRATVPIMYNYLLTHSKDYHERYMALFLFGILYQGYKEDHHLKC